MYRPGQYKKEDPEYIFDFIEAHPFATLVLKGEQLLATHIPVLLQGHPSDFKLYGHIAKANDQFEYLKDGLEALLIFQGAQDYISSSWYHQKEISTWDYSAVHINATLKLQSKEELLKSLQNLTNTFEQKEKHPVLYQDIPKKMIAEHLPLIKGFWCIPTEIKAVAKLHQGADERDIASVVDHLRQRSTATSTALAENIEKEHGRDH